MKERPILFSAPMVRAILAGTKTQTRRVVNLPADAKHVCYWAPPSGRSESGYADPGVNYWTPDPAGETDSNHLNPCPYGQPGDRLWVRETWRITGDSPEDMLDMFDRDDVQYRADDDQSYIDKYRPSIHMPRWASRILLEVIAVRVERLQDISEADAVAEGVDFAGHTDEIMHDYSPDERFSMLWESINGAGSWNENPWVWVVEFRRVEA